MRAIEHALIEALAVLGHISILAELLADREPNDTTQALAYSIHALANKSADELMDAIDAPSTTQVEGGAA